MNFLIGAYYACINEYVTEPPNSFGNSFLDTVMTSRYRQDDGYSCLNDFYDDIVNSNRRSYWTCTRTVAPKFTVGLVYKCFTDGSLIDDNKKIQKISEENKDKFIPVEFNVSENIRKFIEKLKPIINITIEPKKLLILDENKFDATHDPSTFNVAFSCNATSWHGAIYSYGVLLDENSISESVQDLWKRLRVKSPQCVKIKRSLEHLSTNHGVLPHPHWGNDWDIYINRI